MKGRTPSLSPADRFIEEFEDLEDLTTVVDSLAAVEPPVDVLDRVLTSTSAPGRLERFTDMTAALLDLTGDAAARLLDALDDEDSWEPGFLPGMQLCHVRGGPAVTGAVTGFVRLSAGATFPDHEHLGEETVLILQGRCTDAGRVFGPGDRVFMPAGSVHNFTVAPGPDLLYLAVVHEGLRVGELLLTADDPRG